MAKIWLKPNNSMPNSLDCKPIKLWSRQAICSKKGVLISSLSKLAILKLQIRVLDSELSAKVIAAIPFGQSLV